MRVQMLSAFNGKERTVAQFDDLLREAGWKIVLVFHHEGLATEIARITAVPVSPEPAAIAVTRL